MFFIMAGGDGIPGSQGIHTLLQGKVMASSQLSTNHHSLYTSYPHHSLHFRAAFNPDREEKLLLTSFPLFVSWGNVANDCTGHLQDNLLVK